MQRRLLAKDPQIMREFACYGIYAERPDEL